MNPLDDTRRGTDRGEVELYRNADGSVELDVRLDSDTVWLTQQQIAELFGRAIPTINEHITNAEAEELAGEATIRDFRIVRSEGAREVIRSVKHYNLDMILSVGYRVKSPEGVQFRRWSNGILRRYLVDGVVRNERRLAQVNTIVRILERSDDEMVNGIAELIQRYSAAHRLLDEYDHGTLPAPTGDASTVRLDYNTARSVVDAIAQEFPADTMFGVERGGAFQGILGQIEQTFVGEDVYSSTQEKAAHLLYFVVKDHPFSDGNKRSGAALFTHYLQQNRALQGASGDDLITPNTLAAVTLMTAMSKPEEKDTIIRLLTSMLGR